MELDSAQGQMIDLPINVIGAYTGSAVEQLTKGQSYILKITADAAWTMKIEEPTTSGAVALPHTYRGTGQTVVGPFQGGDAIKYVAKNASTGGSNFAVTLYNADGSEADLPFNEIGSFSGSTISNDLNGGPYWMGIDSDGTWSIATSGL